MEKNRMELGLFDDDTCPSQHVCCLDFTAKSLHWRHNDHDGVSNHQPHDCLLNRLYRRRSKETSKLRVTGLCVGNSPGPVNSPHKGPVTRKMFPFDDVIMWCSPSCHDIFHMTGPLWGIHLSMVDSYDRKGPATWGFHVFFDISLNKLFNKQSICCWFEMQWHSCDSIIILLAISVLTNWLRQIGLPDKGLKL